MKMFKGQEDLRVRRTHKLLWKALMALKVALNPKPQVVGKED